MKIDGQHRSVVSQAVHNYRASFHTNFNRHLQEIGLHHTPPTEVAIFLQRLDELREVIDRLPPEGGDVDDGYGPLLREAVIDLRLRLAVQADVRRAHALHPELLEQIDKELLQPYRAVMATSWFREARAATVPRVSDYFPIEDVEKALAQSPSSSASERSYDEKFHILQAPSLFLPDLDAARVASKIRDASVAVAYLDIDDFKALNTAHGESFVDRNVLPSLMRRLEAHVYMRGRAYRFGGDEYVVLLNNTSKEEGLGSMDRLRKDLEGMTYTGVDRKVTVSIGLVIVTGSCHLTGPELEERAATAKNYAKQNGRNRIATYEDLWFERLVVARPVAD